MATHAMQLGAQHSAPDQEWVPTIALAFAGIAALVQSLWIPVDADVSWLITVGEGVLGGQRLYADLVEVNPPASVWLYLPWVWLAQLLHFRPEPVVIGATIVGATISLIATLQLSRQLRQPPSAMWLAASAGFALMILPGGLFAQREHVALMLAIPALTMLAVLSQGVRLSLSQRLAGGLAAGLIIVIKPHFAFAILLAAGWTSLRSRSVRVLLLPAAMAAIVVTGYALAVGAFAPSYFDLLPMLAATYLPMRDQALNFLIGPLLLVPSILLSLAFLLRPKGVSPLVTALSLGGAGFVLAGLLQGKNYLNHALPGMALASIALALLLSGRAEPHRERLVAGAAALILALQVFGTFSVQPPPGLAAEIQRSAPSGATVMTLGTELATGHPAVRLAGARWVGSRPSLFTAAGARYAGLHLPQVRRWYDADLQAFRSDVLRAQPQLILVEDRSRAWLFAEPLVRASMANYSPVARAGSVEVWRRR